MWQTLRLFCKKNTFIEIKVQHQSYLLPKVHFCAQTLLGLKLAGFFEDRNSILDQLESMNIDKYLISTGNGMNFNKIATLNKAASLVSTGSDLNILNSLSDIGNYEKALNSSKKPKNDNLRYFLIKGIYTQKTPRDTLRGSVLAKSLYISFTTG